MGWDPAVLRKYNTTGHFRLLNQARVELKANPLIRPRDGETVGAANRSKGLTRALEKRSGAGIFASSAARHRRTLRTIPSATIDTPSLEEPTAQLSPSSPDPLIDANTRSFRERLDAIQMR